MASGNVYKPRYKLAFQTKSKIWPYKNSRLRRFFNIRGRKLVRRGLFKRVFVVFNNMKWNIARRYIRPYMRKRRPVRRSYRTVFYSKQQLRAFCGKMNETAFRNFFKAYIGGLNSRSTSFFSALERRADIFFYRLRFLPTIYACNQLIHHQGIKINGKVIKSPNTVLCVGDTLSFDKKWWHIFSEYIAYKLTTRAWGKSHWHRRIRKVTKKKYFWIYRNFFYRKSVVGIMKKTARLWSRSNKINSRQKAQLKLLRTRTLIMEARLRALLKTSGQTDQIKINFILSKLIELRKQFGHFVINYRTFKRWLNVNFGLLLGNKQQNTIQNKVVKKLYKKLYKTKYLLRFSPILDNVQKNDSVKELEHKNFYGSYKLRRFWTFFIKLLKNYSYAYKMWGSFAHKLTSYENRLDSLLFYSFRATSDVLSKNNILEQNRLDKLVSEFFDREQPKTYKKIELNQKTIVDMVRELRDLFLAFKNDELLSEKEREGLDKTKQEEESVKKVYTALVHFVSKEQLSKDKEAVNFINKLNLILINKGNTKAALTEIEAFLRETTKTLLELGNRSLNDEICSLVLETRSKNNDSAYKLMNKKIMYLFTALARRRFKRFFKKRFKQNGNEKGMMSRSALLYFLKRRARKSNRRKSVLRLRPVHWYIPPYIYMDFRTIRAVYLYEPRPEEITYSFKCSLRRINSFYRSRGY